MGSNVTKYGPPYWKPLCDEQLFFFQELADSLNIPYIEVSAKTCTNVEIPFVMAVCKVLQNKRLEHSIAMDTLRLTTQDDTNIIKDASCC